MIRVIFILLLITAIMQIPMKPSLRPDSVKILVDKEYMICSNNVCPPYTELSPNEQSTAPPVIMRFTQPPTIKESQ